MAPIATTFVVAMEVAARRVPFWVGTRAKYSGLRVFCKMRPPRPRPDHLDHDSASILCSLISYHVTFSPPWYPAFPHSQTFYCFHRTPFPPIAPRVSQPQTFACSHRTQNRPITDGPSYGRGNAQFLTGPVRNLRGALSFPKRIHQSSH